MKAIWMIFLSVLLCGAVGVSAQQSNRLTEE